MSDEAPHVHWAFYLVRAFTLCSMVIGQQILTYALLGGGNFSWWTCFHYLGFFFPDKNTSDCMSGIKESHVSSFVCFLLKKT